MKVVLADHGAGNLRSVSSALRRAGAQPVVSNDPAEVAAAPLAVIAGVGHTAASAAGLAAAGLDLALRERVAAGRPVFGICVGLQLLFGASEEGGEGLGLLAGRVVRVEAKRVPHMGWNTLELTRPSALFEPLEGADVYFAHSFTAVPEEPEVVAAVTDHGGSLVAAVEAGPLAGVQFHPERSGAAGHQLLVGLLEWATVGARTW